MANQETEIIDYPEAGIPETSERSKLWNAVCSTNPRFLREVDQRGGYTAINPQYQNRMATTLWGPYGIQWGLRNVSFEYVGAADKVPEAVVMHCTFFYPVETSTKPFIAMDEGTLKAINDFIEEGSLVRAEGEATFPISVDMAWKKNDDVFKKLRTQAQSKALSLIGFNADIFMAIYDEAIPTDPKRGPESRKGQHKSTRTNEGPSQRKAKALMVKRQLTINDLEAFISNASDGAITSVESLDENNWKLMCTRIEEGAVKAFCDNFPDAVKAIELRKKAQSG